MGDFLGGLGSKIYDKYGKEYAGWFMSMLTSPASIVSKSRQVRLDGTQGEYLLTVLATSIFLGATIGTMIPNRPPMQDRVVVFAVVSLLWLFLSLLVHFFCRMIGGKEEAQITVSLMTQNLAFVYVASNFLTLLITWVTLAYEPLRTDLEQRQFFKSPGDLLFVLQFLILLYLVPMTVSYAQGFRGFRWFMVAVFAACFAVLFGFPVFAQHSC